MGALRRFAIGAALLIAAPATAQSAPDPVDRWRPIIAEASRTFGVPEAWIVAVMRAESGGHTMLDGRPITRRAGARGLMQLMPASYADLRRRPDPGTNPHEPSDHIRARTLYLPQLYTGVGNPGLFARPR